MRRPALSIVGVGAALAALTACDREPRSQSFFEGNDAERAEVLADCKVGNHRGPECENAQLAQLTLQSKNRRSATREMLQQKYEGEPAK